MSTEDVFVVEGSLCTLLDLCQKVEKTVAQLVEAGYVDKLQIPIAVKNYTYNKTISSILRTLAISIANKNCCRTMISIPKIP